MRLHLRSWLWVDQIVYLHTRKAAWGCTRCWEYPGLNWTMFGNGGLMWGGHKKGLKLDDLRLNGLLLECRIHIGIDGRQWVDINNSIGGCAAGLRIHVGIDGRQWVDIKNCVGHWDSFVRWGGGMGSIVILWLSCEWSLDISGDDLRVTWSAPTHMSGRFFPGSFQLRG